MAAPIIRLYLNKRLRAGKEDGARLSERLGQPSAERPPGPLVWLHAASVGEALSMLTVIERIMSERPSVGLLMTSGTVSSARLLAERLPPTAIHQFVPVDHPGWVRRFLDHWKPDLALWVESELWPNLLAEIETRKVPLVLVNARMSDRSLRRWRRWPRTIGDLLERFDLCLAQSEEVATRLVELGATNVRCPGNLKYTAAPLPVDERALTQIRKAVSGRPVWVASSTHPGEETLIAEAHRHVAAHLDGLLTVIVPRHANRGPEIAAQINGNTALRSRGDAITADIEFYIADSMGELGVFYRLSRIVFMGGSLIPHGGQNPLEPAKLGCAVLHGPHMENFRAVCDELVSSGATVAVAGAEDLAREVALLLENDALSQERGRFGQAVADAKMEILDAVFDSLDPYLDRLSPRAAEHLKHARA